MSITIILIPLLRLRELIDNSAKIGYPDYVKNYIKEQGRKPLFASYNLRLRMDDSFDVLVSESIYSAGDGARLTCAECCCRTGVTLYGIDVSVINSFDYSDVPVLSENNDVAFTGIGSVYPFAGAVSETRIARNVCNIAYTADQVVLSCSLVAPAHEGSAPWRNVGINELAL